MSTTTDPPPGTVLLEWTYTPADYFEEVVHVQRSDYRMTIDSGTAVAAIDAATYDATPDMRKKVHADLDARFLGMQVFRRRPYQFSSSLETRDGRKASNIECGVGGMVMVGMQAQLDVRAVDANGNVIVDTKRDRIAKETDFAELVERHRTDIVGQSMLKSYRQAMSDPQNELVHLYEIREALGKGAKGSAQTTFGLSKGKWRDFGDLCNDKPVRQGRHRGKHPGQLRDATQAELEEARAFARAMIEAYLRSL